MMAVVGTLLMFMIVGEIRSIAALCPDLVDPAYGYLVIQTGNSVGDIAAYNCFPCFELVGATTLTCQNDGLWSDPPPTCQMIGSESIAADGLVVKVFPEDMTVPSGDEVTYICQSNIPTALPEWEINSNLYTVTDLPSGYEANGANLTFRAYYNITTIRCSFSTVINGMFVQACSNLATLTTSPPYVEFPVRDDDVRCKPVNIIFEILEKQSYISWDIDMYCSDCKFRVNISDCSQCSSDTDTCVISSHTVYSSNIKDRHVRTLLCLETDLPYPDGVMVNIKWDNPNCAESNNNCSTYRFLPNITKTEIIELDEKGSFTRDISNRYCDVVSSVRYLRVCFESSVLNGCFEVMNNPLIRMVQCTQSPDPTQPLCLEVTGINSNTSTSVFCTQSEETPCPTNRFKTNIFNFKLIVDATSGAVIGTNITFGALLVLTLVYVIASNI